MLVQNRNVRLYSSAPRAVQSRLFAPFVPVLSSLSTPGLTDITLALKLYSLKIFYLFPPKLCGSACQEQSSLFKGCAPHPIPLDCSLCFSSCWRLVSGHIPYSIFKKSSQPSNAPLKPHRCGHDSITLHRMMEITLHVCVCVLHNFKFLDGKDCHILLGSCWVLRLTVPCTNTDSVNE